jgi:CheY-like chemotaxis protein
MTLEAAAFDPRLLLGEVGAWLHPRARDKGLELSTEVADEVPEALVGDAFRLRQVLLNLAGNAVKFTARGAVRVRLGASGPERYVFEIVDTGIGIDAAVLPQLFQSFTQADVSTSRRFGGTGLGLSISRGLVEAMGGSVTVTSALGHGTTFRVELPLPTGAPVAAQAVERANVDSDPGLVAERRRRTILVADDDRVNQRIATLFLERSGYRCVVVGDGVRAVEAARAGAVHAVLLDCHMPMLDGPGAAQAIRALPGAAARLPLIALTAAAEQDGPLCLAAGMDAVLAKPVTLAQLVAAVDRWVGIAADSSPALRAAARGSRPPPSVAPPLLPSVAPSA